MILSRTGRLFPCVAIILLGLAVVSAQHSVTQCCETSCPFGTLCFQPDPRVAFQCINKCFFRNCPQGYTCTIDPSGDACCEPATTTPTTAPPPPQTVATTTISTQSTIMSTTATLSTTVIPPQTVATTTVSTQSTIGSTTATLASTSSATATSPATVSVTASASSGTTATGTTATGTSTASTSGVTTTTPVPTITPTPPLRGPYSVRLIAYLDQDNDGTDDGNEGFLGGMHGFLYDNTNGQATEFLDDDDDHHDDSQHTDSNSKDDSVDFSDESGSSSEVIVDESVSTEEFVDATNGEVVITSTAPLRRRNINKPVKKRVQEKKIIADFTTDASRRDGGFYMDGLFAGNYCMSVSDPAGHYDQTKAGKDQYLDEDGDLCFVLSKETTDANGTFSMSQGYFYDGELPEYTIRGFTWFDCNRNGVHDPDEKYLSGMTVYIRTVRDEYLDKDKITSGKLKGNGFRIEGLKPDGYCIEIFDPKGSYKLGPNGVDNKFDKDDNICVSLDQTTVNMNGELTIKCGMVPAKFIVHGYSWVDTNKDGADDSTEPLLNGVVGTLINKDGVELKSFVMDSEKKCNGFRIPDLEKGSYCIKVADPSGQNVLGPIGKDNYFAQDSSAYCFTLDESAVDEKHEFLITAGFVPK
ncbi:hypothetical protein SAMD00019534_044710, partial [Acytostelium subglobosum LB1]|uniref:hypothetical protein n=1 Tax=Acytostelium subglobosum LB1 TaxID=1410327 RepID=UPI000644E485